MSKKLMSDHECANTPTKRTDSTPSMHFDVFGKVDQFVDFVPEPNHCRAVGVWC